MAFADYLGVRYLIPALPFAYLIAGCGAAWLLECRRWWGGAAVSVASVWLLAAAFGVTPDHQSYFNEAACLPSHISQIGLDGGTACGIEWLDDSNVDWGQSLGQLKTWANSHAPGRTIRLAYFGSYSPAAYGLRQEPITLAQLLESPSPGLYAVSAHLVARGPALGAQLRPGTGAGAWLREVTPVAIVGHALYVYDVAPRASASH
jgi:hypothetical protein